VALGADLACMGCGGAGEGRQKRGTGASRRRRQPRRVTQRVPGRDLSSAAVVPRSPLPVPRVDAVVPLAVGEVGLATRVLVAGVVPPPRFGREAEVLAGAAALVAAGADLVDVSLPPRLAGPVAAQAGVSVAARATSAGEVAAAFRVGARLVLVPPDLADAAVTAWRAMASSAMASRSTASRAAAAVGIVVDELPDVPGARAVAEEGGLPLAFDATRRAGAEAIADESAAIAAGCRVLRTGDVRRSRRVAEVMGALLAAGADHDRARGCDS
jgi:hypothetical protein